MEGLKEMSEGQKDDKNLKEKNEVSKQNEKTKETKTKQKEEKKEAKRKAKEEKKAQKNKSKSKAEQEDTKKEQKENAKESKFKQVEKNPKEVKNAVEKMMEYRKKRILIPVGIAFVVIVIALFCSTIFALVNMNNEKIVNGISIAGIDVSGLSKEEAKEKINNLYEEKKSKEIGIKYQEYENTLNPTLLEVNYDTEKAVEEAYSIGKTDNIFVNNYEILFNMIKKKNIDVEATLNEDVAKQTITDIGVNLPGIVIESSHAIEDDELIITKGKEGVIIDTEGLLEKVKERINEVEKNEDYIEIPVKEKEPEAIDIDKICMYIP